MKRSGKFYRKNEKEVMELLGLKPTKNSGSGWVEKEDGESENVLCQLKSTDAGSIRVEKQDLDTLNYHAMISHKLPVFAIQFLQSNEVYLIVKPESIKDIAECIKTGEVPDSMKYAFAGIDFSDCESMTTVYGRAIKSSCDAREQYKREQKEKYGKKVRAAT